MDTTTAHGNQDPRPGQDSAPIDGWSSPRATTQYTLRRYVSDGSYVLVAQHPVTGLVRYWTSRAPFDLYAMVGAEDRY